jgi:hypothetical protein
VKLSITLFAQEVCPFGESEEHILIIQGCWITSDDILAMRNTIKAENVEFNTKPS